jgi:hypothetical protein
LIKKIGILLRGEGQIFHWQHRIVQEVLNDKRFKLTLLLADKKPVTIERLERPAQFSFANMILKLQQVMEEKLLAIDNDRFDIYKLLKTEYKNCPIIQWSTLSKRKANMPNLDVVINLSINLENDVMEDISLDNVWSIFFGDFKEDKRSFPGFWEVVESRQGIGAFLCKIENGDVDNCKLISESYFNRGWSMTETQKIVKEGAVSMVLKELNQWYLGRQNSSGKVNYKALKSTTPNGLSIIKYVFKFYTSLALKIWEKVGNKFLGIRPEKWSLFLGEGDFESCNLKTLKPVSMPKDEFWADPFLFHYQGEDYVFFENYSYRTKRGKISCGQIKNGELVHVEDVMLKDYHLSFPFIFEEEGEIYLMPETSENKRLEIYKASNFPTSWELYATAFEGEMVADPVFYTDEENQRWLFINKQMDKSSPMNSELYIYKVDSLKLDNMLAHSQNPVIIDARVARNGGALFKKNGALYRPSQRNVEGIYGRALNLNKIKKLTLDEYWEEVSEVYYPIFDKNLIAMHHLHQGVSGFVFDAAYKNSLKG